MLYFVVLELQLIELENKLKEETKLRNKAEKRLKLLRKKLESLTMLPASKSQNAVPEISKNVEENAKMHRTPLHL